MKIEVSIIFNLIVLFGCSKNDEVSTISNKSDFCIEQSAVDFLMDELINKDSLFYVRGNDGSYFKLVPQTFLEDSLFKDGLFFWKKIYASNIVKNLSEPYYDSLTLYSVAPNLLNKEQLREAEGFIADFKSKKQLDLPPIKIDLPSTISIINDESFKGRYLDNSLYLQVRHHLESEDRFLVDISIYNLEYDEYKRIVVFMDTECNVLDWKMP